MRSGLLSLRAAAAVDGAYFPPANQASSFSLFSSIPHSTAQPSARGTFGSIGLARDLSFMTCDL